MNLCAIYRYILSFTRCQISKVKFPQRRIVDVDA